MPRFLKQLTAFFCLTFAVSSMAQLPGLKPSKPVTAALVTEQKTIVAGQPFRVAVKLEHQEHWHVYGKNVPEGGLGKPTRVLWKLPEGWKAEDLPWPATQELVSTGGDKIQGYEGTVHLPFKLIPPAGLAVGSSVTLEGTVDALVCDPKSCMPVKLPISANVTVGENVVANEAAVDVFKNLPTESSTPASNVSPEPPQTSGKIEVSEPGKLASVVSAVPQRSFASLLLLAFVGGLILNIMPCVFPVLGIKILGVVNQSGGDKRQIVLHGLAYTFGVLVCFWALASLLLALRSAGGQIAWGFQLQSPKFVFFLATFLFAFGLNMAGLFEVGSSAVGVGSDLTRKSGLGGSFFSGLLATVVATPCAAPFLAPALAFALTLSAAPSLLFFTVIGIGLASPYLILSLFPKLVGLLPRPGAWMESFKQAMSFLMFATVAFLIWTLAGMVDEYGLLKVLLALVLIAIACWIYGRWSTPVKPGATRFKAVVLTLVFLASGLVLAWPQSGKNEGLEWQEWSPEKVTALHRENTPVYIDYTARWCVTCQTNKRVYHDQALQDEFKKLGVVTLKADWTNEDPRITKALAELDKAAVPVNVLYIPGQNEPLVLPELLTVDNVKAALSKVKK